MTTFGLVHGAWHGGWCWQPLIPELEARGHRAVAMDLPTDDPQAGAERYAAVVLEALHSFDEDVVLVGHSLAGLTIPVVASLRPVRQLVYLCAIIPRPGAAWDDVAAEQPAFGHYRPSVPAVGHPDGSASCPEERALELFYHDCPPHLAHWAAGRLGRQYWRVSQEVTPLVAFPDVPASSILCQADRAIDPAWSRAAAQGVLGVQPIELSGGHSPFLAQPAKLAQVLHELSGRRRCQPGRPFGPEPTHPSGPMPPRFEFSVGLSPNQSEAGVDPSIGTLSKTEPSRGTLSESQ